jgi:CDP-glycerol glycerophosphotransferase (TagB/SpsB family)
VSLSFFIDKPADVLMSHGCADKGYHLRERHRRQLLELFKYVLVPGPFLKRKLVDAGVPGDRIFEVGWPMTDHLFGAGGTQRRGRPPGANLTVLWAPSHDYDAAGQTLPVSSYPRFKPHVRELEAAGFAVVQSAHPRNRNKKRATSDLYLEADWVIADFGSTLYEAWQLGIPVIFLDWLVREGLDEKMRRQAETRRWGNGSVPSAEQLVYSRQIGVHCDTVDGVLDALHADRERRNKPPAVGDDVRAFMADYLPPAYNGMSGRRIANVLAQVAPTIESTARIKIAHPKQAKATEDA